VTWTKNVRVRYSKWGSTGNARQRHTFDTPQPLAQKRVSSFQRFDPNGFHPKAPHIRHPLLALNTENFRIYKSHRINHLIRNAAHTTIVATRTKWRQFMKRTAPPVGYMQAAAEMRTAAMAAAMHTAMLQGRVIPSVPVAPDMQALMRDAHKRLQATLPARKHTLKG